MWSYIAETMGNLLHQTAFLNLTWGNYVMIAVACVFLYLAIAKGYEPLLLVPIAFGMLLVNIYPDIIASPEETSNGVGGLLYYFYQLDEWSILPSLIFLGVGAMTDFGPLIANPISFLMGAAAQFGIFAAYLIAILLGFNDKAAAAISIIGGADGTDGADRGRSIFLYVPCPDHSASDHEVTDYEKRTRDPYGQSASGFQTGEDPVPDHRYYDRVPDPSDDSTACWYADARKPVPREWCGKTAL